MAIRGLPWDAICAHCRRTIQVAQINILLYSPLSRIPVEAQVTESCHLRRSDDITDPSPTNIDSHRETFLRHPALVHVLETAHDSSTNYMFILLDLFILAYTQLSEILIDAHMTESSHFQSKIR